MLNFNQEVRAIETGCLSADDSKEILAIASPTQLLAYHVDNNRDIFFKEILEGIRTIVIGTVSMGEQPLVIVGGNRKWLHAELTNESIRLIFFLKSFLAVEYVRGYNAGGDEKLWIVTNGIVTCIAVADVNSDGKSEIIIGCDNGAIQVYQNDTLLYELFENASIEQITAIGKCFWIRLSIEDVWRLSFGKS